jgi:hypothetical protein
LFAPGIGIWLVTASTKLVNPKCTETLSAVLVASIRDTPNVAVKDVSTAAKLIVSFPTVKKGFTGTSTLADPLRSTLIVSVLFVHGAPLNRTNLYCPSNKLAEKLPS